MVGFVYLVTNKLTGRKYVGKKLFWFAKTTYKNVTLKNGTKKRKRIRTQVESDWELYWGSSIELSKDIELLGTRHFTREILHLCTSKAHCTYQEAKEQFARGVLETDDYYNGQISCRIHHKHINK